MTSLSLEALFTSPRAGFGIVTASPLQRAICRLIEGFPLGDLADHDDVIEAVGDVSALAARPTEIDLLAGIRTGKTRLAACLALYASQTVDVGHLATGEIPRVSVISLRLDQARVCLDQLIGTMQASAALRPLLLEEPRSDVLLLRHPTGRPIEVAIVAGARAGGSLVARWSAGAIFDEAPRMVGSDDGAVVNFDDARRAVLGRLLPGAQLIAIGSPWAPFGPMYERCQERWRRPTATHVVIKATGPALNPVWWTPERCEALRASDPIAYVTDVLADFADPESTFLSSAEIRRATREAPLVLPPTSRRRYLAAMDPGTRGNAWALIVLAGYVDDEGVPRYEVARANQWVGSSAVPLSPSATLAQIATVLGPYGNPPLLTDQHSADAIRDIGARAGLKVHIMHVGSGVSSATSANRNALFERLKGVLAEGTIELPPDPILTRDLTSVRRRLTQTGISYVLPRTSDGRHADYVPALALALHGFPDAESSRRQAALAAKQEMVARGLAGFGYGAPGERERYEAEDRARLWRLLSDHSPTQTAL